MSTLSVALATFNEEKNLENCLNAVKEIADEIVVVDGGSSDKTLFIAEKFQAKIIKTDNPIIFHINKQKAIEACCGDWILQLDADEIVTSDLAKEVLEKIKDRNGEFTGYYIPRKNFLLGKEMKFGGLFPDAVIRLFMNGKGKFPCKTVHEQIVIDGKVGYLQNPLIHHSYPKFSDYFRKANAYTSLTANLLKGKKEKINLLNFFNYLFLKPAKTFLTLYIRMRGFKDGFPGFVWAFFSALHHPTAYLKYLILKKDN